MVASCSGLGMFACLTQAVSPGWLRSILFAANTILSMRAEPPSWRSLRNATSMGEMVRLGASMTQMATSTLGRVSK